MNAEDQDYLSLIEARNDPDADKRWLVARLEAEAQALDNEWEASQFWQAKAESAEAERDKLRDLASTYLEDCDKLQARAESAERRAQGAEAQMKQLKAVQDIEKSWSGGGGGDAFLAMDKIRSLLRPIAALSPQAEAQECICTNEATSKHCPIHGTEPQEANHE